MHIAFVQAILILINGTMAFVAYKYPFNEENKKLTKFAYFFGGLCVIWFLGGIYVIYDAINTNKTTNTEKQGLKDTIHTISRNVVKLQKSIDSLGYKADKNTGLLVLKTTKAEVENYSFEKTLSKPYADALLQKIDNLRTKDTITSKRILFYVSTTSNQRKLSYQLQKLLEKRGFQVDVGEGLDSFIGINITTVQFLPSEKVIEIQIGISD